MFNTEDSEPYHFRKSGGGRVRVGDREVDRIVGGTVAWNQLAYKTRANNTDSGVTLTANGDGTYTFNGTASGNPTWVISNSTNNNHVYYHAMKSSGANVKLFRAGYVATRLNNSAQITKIDTANVFMFTVLNGDSANDETVTPQIIDLTQAFGSTIADYIYSLEQSTADAGVAFLRRYIDIDTYHPYDAGTLKSVEGLVSHDMVGWNQWDEEWELGTYSTTDGSAVASNYSIRGKNRFKALPSTEYYFNNPYFRALFYDSNDAFISYVTGSGVKTTPNNTAYIRFYLGDVYGTTYNHDICINLSDPAKNGTYEPYVKHSYSLDSTVTLRGVPKLVDGKLQYDGDTYAADGTVTRRYGVVDLGTLTWTKENNHFYSDVLSTAAYPTAGQMPNIICSKYVPALYVTVISDSVDKTLGLSTAPRLYVYDSAYTDATTFKASLSGVYMIYALATPTTEEAEPFTSPQWVDGSGTEQYVSTSLVPIGHYTQYPEDLKAKIEGLPWDFASLIAPTEASYKATSNYTSGSLLIVNNILYKTTAAIANGGTITPGTNCTATTLAAVIAAL